MKETADKQKANIDRNQYMLNIKIINWLSIISLIAIYGFVFSVGKLTIPVSVVNYFYILNIFALVTFVFQRYYWYLYFESLTKSVVQYNDWSDDKITKYKEDVVDLENKLYTSIYVILLFLFIIMLFEISTQFIKYDKSMVKLVSTFFGYYTGTAILGGLIYYQNLIMKHKVIDWVYFDKH